MLRQSSLICMHFNIKLEVTHIQGIENGITASMSHLQVGEFRRETLGHMNQIPGSRKFTATELQSHADKIFAASISKGTSYIYKKRTSEYEEFVNKN